MRKAIEASDLEHILQSNPILDTSREHAFDPRLKWALVLEFFVPGTRDTFSPGWWLQPGLKVPVQWLLRQTEVAETFSPGWSHQPGLKVYFYSRLVDPTGSKGLLPGRGCAEVGKLPLVPVGATNRD